MLPLVGGVAFPVLKFDSTDFAKLEPAGLAEAKGFGFGVEDWGWGVGDGEAEAVDLLAICWNKDEAADGFDILDGWASGSSLTEAFRFD